MQQHKLKILVHKVKELYLNTKDTVFTTIRTTYRNNEVACDAAIFVGLITLAIVIGEILERNAGVSI